MDFVIDCDLILSLTLVSLQKVSQMCSSLGWSIIFKMPATLDLELTSNGLFLQ